MNRTDRLLAIVLELQRKGRVRAEDLAATFETSKRTIYRDMQALSEAGVPLAASPGTGYTLMDGYFLPPVSFTADEAALLLFGAEYAADHLDQKADSAIAKIEAILPDEQRRRVEQWRDAMRFLSLNIMQSKKTKENPRNEQVEVLHTVRTAVLENQRLSITYQKQGIPHVKEPVSSRIVDPYGLVLVLGNWHLVGYCHLRQDIRQFRLNRIQSLTILEEMFERPADFSIHQYQPAQNRSITVRALFSHEVTSALREQRSFYWCSDEETPEGIIVTLMVRHEDDALQWLMGWGAYVRILEPASLGQKIAEHARSILAHYEPHESR